MPPFKLGSIFVKRNYMELSNSTTAIGQIVARSFLASNADAHRFFPNKHNSNLLIEHMKSGQADATDINAYSKVFASS
jgi:hypothetical protein